MEKGKEKRKRTEIDNSVNDDSADASQPTSRTDQVNEHLDSLTKAASIRNKRRNTNKGEKRSFVWQHFRTTTIDGSNPIDQLITCQYCNWNLLESARKNSTSNMKNHLKKHNITEKGALTGDAQLNPVEQKKQYEDDIIQMIIEEDLPFSFIESKGFEQLLNNLGYNELRMSASTVKRRIESTFEQSRHELISLLDNTCESIAISLDAWTSPNNHSFLGIIGSWIGPDFVFMKGSLNSWNFQADTRVQTC